MTPGRSASAPSGSRDFQRVIGILQPVYLPWLGYFEQIATADVFVVLDTVQYTAQDWRNRNRIKAASGAMWLTVPVRQHPLNTPISEIAINNDLPWRRKHLSSIKQSYARCPFVSPFFDELSDEINRDHASLVNLDLRLILLLCRYLEIDTPIHLASDLRLDGRLGSHSTNPTQRPGQPFERLLRICRDFDADCFYEGASGANYLDEDTFQEAGIEVVFQDYGHPEYQQAHGPFLPHISAIDLIMNTGPEAPSILRSSPVPEGLRRLPKK